MQQWRQFQFNSFAWFNGVRKHNLQHPKLNICFARISHTNTHTYRTNYSGVPEIRIEIWCTNWLAETSRLNWFYWQMYKQFSIFRCSVLLCFAFGVWHLVSGDIMTVRCVCDTVEKQKPFSLFMICCIKMYNG